MFRRVVVVLALMLGGISAAAPAQAFDLTGAIVTSQDCQATMLPSNDDASSPEVALPFTLNFYGRSFSSLYVNNNGNVTFTAPLADYTPFPLSSAAVPIIAPFFGDVDTRVPSPGDTFYGFGSTLFEGRPAFCVNWLDVGYFQQSADLQNSFQLLLVDRSDVAFGDFDIVFNYGSIQWETGSASGGTAGFGGTSARVGFSNGSTDAGTTFELEGSGVPGSFLDTGSAPLISRQLSSDQIGRLRFAVRGSTPQTAAPVFGASSPPDGSTVFTPGRGADFTVSASDPDGTDTTLTVRGATAGVACTTTGSPGTRPAVRCTAPSSTTGTVLLSFLARDASGAESGRTIWVGPGRYYALGDSFSSGEGAGSYLAGTDTSDGSNRCHRAVSTAYPQRLARSGLAMVPSAFTFVACSGAKIEDVLTKRKNGEAPQIQRLGSDARLLTLTIGGNDVDFASIIAACVAGRESCERTKADGLATEFTRMQTADQAGLWPLQATYVALRKAAPRARIIVLGYPRFFDKRPVGTCAVGISTGEQSWINGRITAFNDIIRTSAERARVEFVDVEDAFDGHELCGGGNEAMTGVMGLWSGGDQQQSFHPNALGHQLLVDRLTTYLTGTPATTVQENRAFALAQGALRTFTVAVNPVAAAIAIASLWPGSDMDITLTSPSGEVFSRSRVPAGSTRVTTGFSEYVAVDDPEPGTWTVSVRAQRVSFSGEPVVVSAAQVMPTNQLPVVRLPSLAQVQVGQTVDIAAELFEDPDGRVNRTDWDFGDGTRTSENAAVASASHVFDQPGLYTVSVDAYDDRLGVTRATTSLRVIDPAVPVGVAPSALTAARRSHGITLGWTAPSGVPVTGFVAQVMRAGSAWGEPIDVVASARQLRLDGLVDGATYSVRLATANDGGIGPWSSPVSAVPASGAELVLGAARPAVVGDPLSLRVQVRRSDLAPVSGWVTVGEAGRTLARAAVVKGSALVTLPVATALGRRTFRVAYGGSASTLAVAGSRSLVVAKAVATAKVRAAKKRVAPRQRIALVATVSRAAVSPRAAGTVKILVNGKAVKTLKLIRGKATWSVKLKKKGRYAITVVYRGNATTAATRSKAVIVVVR